MKVYAIYYPGRHIAVSDKPFIYRDMIDSYSWHDQGQRLYIYPRTEAHYYLRDYCKLREKEPKELEL